MTSVGLIQFKRRIYKDETGQRRKPIDELLGIEPRCRQSLSVQQKGSFLASELPYREAEEEDQRKRVFEQAEELEPGRTPAKVL